jgi:hypothetical protein
MLFGVWLQNASRRWRRLRSSRSFRRNKQSSSPVYVEQLEERVLLSTVQFSEDVRVDASADDAEENTLGGVNITSTDVELTEDGGGTQTVGLRFNNVDIPNSATITNAYVQFQVDEIDTEATTLQIAAQASGMQPRMSV